jgi:predicted CXXCH cytochrome family protein
MYVRMGAALVVLSMSASLLLHSCTGTRQVSVNPAFTIAGAEYIGMETCAMCHETVVRDFKHADHSRYISLRWYDADVGACESCHGPGSLHVEAGGGAGVHILNPRTNPVPCYGCHLSVQGAFSLQYRHPVPEGRILCVDCHDPHGKDIFATRQRPVLRENEVCDKCHKDKTRPFVFEHEAVRDGCTVCHRTHGSINEKLLIERDSNLCLKCHSQLAMPGAYTIGVTDHTFRLTQGPCWSAGCHTAVHGSNISSSLRY